MTDETMAERIQRRAKLAKHVLAHVYGELGETGFAVIVAAELFKRELELERVAAKDLNTPAHS